MRPLLHVVSVVLLLPSLVLASGFLLLGHAISGATLFGLLDRLLNDALWLVTWGVYAAIAVLVAILVGGLVVQTRWLAGLAVALLSLASAVVIIVLHSGSISFGQWLFLVPGFIALCIGAWLAVDGWTQA